MRSPESAEINVVCCYRELPGCRPLVLAVCSLTVVLHVVRAGVHVGDPAELRDAGHVSSVRGHHLRLREVQDPAGKTVSGSTCHGCNVFSYENNLHFPKAVRICT